MDCSWLRRNLLVGAGGALVLPLFVPRQVVGGEAGPAPSERVDVAIVGLGGRARRIVGESRDRCTADIEIGHRSTTLCHLVNIVREVGRVGEVLRWNPVAERLFYQLRRSQPTAEPTPPSRL